MKVSFEGVKKGASATLTTLTAPGGLAFSDVGRDVVKTSTKKLKAGADGVVEFDLEALSVSVLEVKPR